MPKGKTTYQKEIQEAFDRFVYDNFKDDDGRVVVVQKDGTVQAIPPGESDKRTYLSAQKVGDNIVVTFDSSKVKHLFYREVESKTKEIAELLKKNGFENVTLTPQPQSGHDENKPTLTFTTPDTLETIQKLSKLFRATVIADQQYQLQTSLDELPRTANRLIEEAKRELAQRLGEGGGKLAFREVMDAIALPNLTKEKQGKAR